MPNYNQRYAFVTSVPLEQSQGWGTATAIMGLLKALNRKGKKVGLVTPSTPLGSALWRRWWFNVHVTRTLRSLDVDVVIGIDCDGYRFAQSESRTPCAMFLHGVKADEVEFSEGPERRRLIREAQWEERAVRAADLVITPSEYSRSRACQLYDIPPAKTAVVYNGLDLDEWPVQPFHENENPVILASANFTPRKGLPTLLKAWKMVSDEQPNVCFRLAGDGPIKQQLIGISHDLWGDTPPVSFPGLLRVGELRVEYASCDIFCLSSRQEAFGMVFLEAMATGRPVVGTRCSALPEVIGKGGIMVPPDQPEALAHALLELLSSQKSREQWGARARAQAEQFTWDSSAQKFGEVLSNI